MNKLDLIKEMNLKQAAHYLCYLHDDCDKCPQAHRCRQGKNGWLVYLSRDATDGDRCAVGMEPLELEKLKGGKL